MHNVGLLWNERCRTKFQQLALHLVASLNTNLLLHSCFYPDLYLWLSSLSYMHACSHSDTPPCIQLPFPSSLNQIRSQEKKKKREIAGWIIDAAQKKFYDLIVRRACVCMHVNKIVTCTSSTAMLGRCMPCCTRHNQAKVFAQNSWASLPFRHPFLGHHCRS